MNSKWKEFLFELTHYQMAGTQQEVYKKYRYSFNSCHFPLPSENVSSPKGKNSFLSWHISRWQERNRKYVKSMATVSLPHLNMCQLQKERIHFGVDTFPDEGTQTGSPKSCLSLKLAEYLPYVSQYTICYSFASARLLHSSYLYQTIHKKHHEFTAPLAIAATYAHPLEFAFGNLLTAALGPLLLGSCQVTTIIWSVLAMAITTIHHSGYHLPLLPSPEFHDYHHLK